jgi:hypothetical protein
LKTSSIRHVEVTERGMLGSIWSSDVWHRVHFKCHEFPSSRALVTNAQTDISSEDVWLGRDAHAWWIMASPLSDLAAFNIHHDVLAVCKTFQSVCSED